MRARVTVIGLGPADERLVNAATRAEIDRVPVERQFLRTTRHPAASLLEGAHSFDNVYEREPTLPAVYTAIVSELVQAAVGSGEVLYAVPGSPVVAERTVELLLADERVETVMVPSMSFLDLVWVRLAVDPVATGVRMIDGQRFEVEAAGQRGPFLVAQCDTRNVLSEVKLAIGAAIEASERCPDPVKLDGSDGDVRGASRVTGPDVVVIRHLGLPDESVTELRWDDLDRVIEPDHLTSLYVPRLAAPVAGEVQRLVELVATLRRECPWDREQTHESLERHLLEETYEVLDAIDHLDAEDGTGYEHLEEELGDLLFQILFHSVLASEQGRFTLADVARTVHDKLYSRHPHVFGGVPDGLAAGDTVGEVVSNWEQIKKVEKGRTSVFEGIPDALPALIYALKVQKKASTLGELGADLPAPAKWDPVVFAAKRTPTSESIGELLFAVVSLARHAEVDPEMALRGAAIRYRDVLRELEH